MAIFSYGVLFFINNIIFAVVTLVSLFVMLFFISYIKIHAFKYYLLVKYSDSIKINDEDWDDLEKKYKEIKESKN